MIQTQSILKVGDNTGARALQCLKVLGGASNKAGKIGDTIVVSVKKTLAHRKVKRKEVHRAVIIHTKKKYRRKNGMYVSFDENKAVLTNPTTGVALGTRLFGPVLFELRRNHPKIAGAASRIL